MFLFSGFLKSLPLAIPHFPQAAAACLPAEWTGFHLIFWCFFVIPFHFICPLLGSRQRRSGSFAEAVTAAVPAAGQKDPEGRGLLAEGVEPRAEGGINWLRGGD